VDAAGPHFSLPLILSCVLNPWQLPAIKLAQIAFCSIWAPQVMQKKKRHQVGTSGKEIANLDLRRRYHSTKNNLRRLVAPQVETKSLCSEDTPRV